MDQSTINSNVLSKPELLDLDSRIDARIPQFELLRTSRRAALKALLTEFDAHVQQTGTDTDLTLRSLRYRGLYNALNHAVRWIHEYCPVTVSEGLVDSNTAALELLAEAISYDQIWVQMSLALKGRNLITRIGEDRYLVTSANDENQELETARSLMAAAHFPDTVEDAANLPIDVADEIRRGIKIDGVTGCRLNYSIPEEVYRKAAETMQDRRLYQFKMDPSWDLGGYTFAQLERVWDVLKVLEAIHQLALQKLPRQRDRRRLNLKTRSLNEWVSEISRYAELSFDETKSVFEDLVYNPALYVGSGKKAHIMYQPFIDLGTNEIAQCNSLVMMSVVEKCSWILTEILRPKVHGELKNRKERYWIETGFVGYETESLRIFPNIKFKQGDIDILFLDIAEDFALIAQLKWTTSMDNVTGVESDDKQYRVGVEQAKRALDWAENHRTELEFRLGLSPGSLQQTSFHPIVIAKETLPSGVFDSPEVPVINEDLFHWIMKDPHNLTLRQLWEISKQAEFLPKENVHYEMFEPEPLEWGELTFMLQGVAYRSLPRRWDPAVDLMIS